jgi:heme-degrading monooxygenase HmoA
MKSMIESAVAAARFKLRRPAVEVAGLHIVISLARPHVQRASMIGLHRISESFPMIAVIFEVWPARSSKDEYLAIAATLREDLTKIDGFISVERFQSLSDPDKLLSLSFWRDEEAVKNWRNHVRHRESQARGRAGIFADYRLRIADTIRDYGMKERTDAPDDSRVAHGEIRAP